MASAGEWVPGDTKHTINFGTNRNELCGGWAFRVPPTVQYRPIGRINLTFYSLLAFMLRSTSKSPALVLSFSPLCMCVMLAAALEAMRHSAQDGKNGGNRAKRSSSSNLWSVNGN